MVVASPEEQQRTISVESGLSQERSKRQKSSAPLRDIPAISLKAFFGGTEAEKAGVAKQWDAACRDVGFIKVRQEPRAHAPAAAAPSARALRRSSTTAFRPR